MEAEHSESPMCLIFPALFVVINVFSILSVPGLIIDAHLTNSARAPTVTSMGVLISGLFENSIPSRPITTRNQGLTDEDSKDLCNQRPTS